MALEAEHILRLTDPDVAQLLVDPHAQRFLRPFLGQECTSKAAAEQLSVSLSLMAYWLGRFQEAGLLRVVRLEPRAGRHVKVYRSVADVFIAPFERLPAATLMEFFDTFGATERRRFVRALGRVAETWLSSDWSLRVRLNEEGRLQVDAIPDPAKTDVLPDFLAQGAPAAWQSFSTLRLHFDEAKALQRELAELWERYSNKDEGRVYHLHLGLVQDEPE